MIKKGKRVGSKLSNQSLIAWKKVFIKKLVWSNISKKKYTTQLFLD